MSTNPSYGVIFHPRFPPERLVRYARQAEATGFGEIWLWEDCFNAGALTSAATMLAATDQIKVGIGLMPATVRNPLFAAMEITTLACLYPGRFLPGFGHGVESWMKQIGAYPKSTLKALEETVTAVRSLLRGEMTTLHGSHIHLEQVQMLVTCPQVPPLFVGGIREKSLRLAGRVGDGTILTALSSPAYIRWARQQVQSGMDEAGRAENHLTAFVWCKAGRDAQAARAPVRRALASVLQNSEFHLEAMGIAEEGAAFVQRLGPEEAARQMPDAWVDALSASGTPEQAADSLRNMAEAGADSLILEPIEGDVEAFESFLEWMGPILRD